MVPLWRELLDLIFPPRPECPFCGKRGRKGEICPSCLNILGAYRLEPYCRKCGRLAGKGACLLPEANALLCPECRKRGWPFALARAAGPYEGILKDAIHRFKYGGRRSLAGSLAGLMAQSVLQEKSFSAVELLVPVPLSREKLRHRGFNQAALLAREVGDRLQIAVVADALAKGFETPPQAGLSRSARQANLEGAFQVTNEAKVRGKNILLIDDVFTTGSTLSAAAAVLLRSGAAQIFCLTASTGRFF